MSPLVLLLVCLGGAAAFWALEWLLSRSQRQADVIPTAPGSSAAPPASEIGTGAPPVRGDVSPDAGSILTDAVVGLDLSGAAFWVEPAGHVGEGPIQPSRAEEIDLIRPAHGSAGDLSNWLRPWRHALLAGETVSIPDAASEPDLCAHLRLPTAQLVLVPFLHTSSQLGVLVLAWNRPASAGTDQLESARRVASRLRSHLEPGVAGRDAEVHHEQETVLLRVAAALRHAADLPLTLRTILEAMRDGLGIRNAAILLADSEKGQLYVASQVGYGEGVDGLRLSLDGPSVTATAARERRVVDVPEVAEWPGYVPGDDDIRSEIALPLIADGELHGVLDVESTQSDAFSGPIRRILSAVASEAALVLAHGHSLRSLQERADQLQAADRLARAITTSINPTAILERTVREVRASIDADDAVVLRRSPDDESPWTVAAVASGKTINPPPAGDLSGTLHEMIATPEGGVFEDTEGNDSSLAVWCALASWRSAFWMPVILDDRAVGLFVAGMYHPRALTEGREAILRALSPHVVAAIRNAQLYEQLEFSYHQLHEASSQSARNEQLRVLGEITSGLAHRFNNLLGVILGRVQTAAARAEGTDLERDLRIVEQAAYEGSITIRQLQQFTGTRAERASRPVAWSEIVERSLERAVRNWRPDDGEDQRYRVHSEIAESAWLEGLPEECEEVAEHLLHNAVEAMPNGGTLTVRLAAGNEAWVLEVTDTGPGIDEQARARMFHPFVTTKGPRNLGLGLSIAYAIVTRHGGEIEADRGPDGGALLRVVLPATDAPAESERPEVLRPQPARVLIVDDEPAVAEVLCEMLQTAGHECVIENSAAVAVERLATESFDVVLSDLGMPGMTGWDLAFHCRDMHGEVPVILITGWGLEVGDTRLAEAGVQEVLAKPFEMPVVLDAVARALQRARSEAA